MDDRGTHADHFESARQQEDAAKLGIAIFLGSEALLFAGLFALFLSYRAHYPAAFAEGVSHNTKLLGSVNTGLLLVSSTLVALGVQALKLGKHRRCALLVFVTMLLGFGFVAIKVTEYLVHFREGIFPGGRGSFFLGHAALGLPEFWTLYFTTTGLHAVHVLVGVTVLGFMLVGVLRGRIAMHRTYPLEIGAMYWHLVDIIWIFLWPLLYLA